MSLPSSFTCFWRRPCVVEWYGTANNAAINSGGVQYVYGTCNSATINSGGVQFVYSGATANNTAISNLGLQVVEGTAHNTAINGGVEWIHGGLANNVTFTGTDSTLELDKPSQLTGTITNWQIGDR